MKKGFETNIAIVTLIPGTPVAVLNDVLKSGIRGLVLLGFGPGNIAYQYLEAIRLANTLKIPVVVTTQCREGATMMHLYDVGKQALKLGAIQAYDMSLESIVTKMMWALKHAEKYEQIKEIMHTNFSGEINKEGKIF